MDSSKSKGSSSAVTSSTAAKDRHRVIFIRPDNVTQPSREMELAYEKSITHYGSVVWQSSEQFNSDSVDVDNKVFICQDFEGKVFKKLKENNARIFGPMFILSCCEKSLAISPKQNLSYTASMCGLRICCTNITRPVRIALYEKIQLMGGAVRKSLTTDVTHLVAGEVSSKKYQVACASNVIVMLPEWVDECWRLSQKEIIHATDKAFSAYLCPIFKGLNITVTQIDAKERMAVQNIVESNGGIYSGLLKVGVTTHLVALEMNGQKYRLASKSNMCCVKLAWIYDSVEKGYCLDENLYKLDGSKEDRVFSSTPTKANAVEKGFSGNDVSCASTILSRSTINETAVSHTSILEHLNRDSRGVSRSTATLDCTILEALERCQPKSRLFLDGCNILISGFSPVITEKLRKILNIGGATRFNLLNESVSHVILGNGVDEHHPALVEGKFRPHVVNINWLFECVNSDKPVDESAFYSLKVETKKGAISPFPKPNASSLQKTASFTDAAATCASPIKELDDQIMSQYLPAVHDDTSDKIFCGFSFVILGFDDDDDGTLRSMIIENEGLFKDANEDCNPDYAVVPITGFSDDIRAQQIVTNFWVQSCLEDGVFKKVSDHPLFTPIDIDDTSEPLSQCVLSVTQFDGAERDCFVHIIELLGGRYQDSLSRCTSHKRDLLATTHLVAKSPEGSKYNGAISWGILVVSFNWLLACAKADTKVDETPYLVGTTDERGPNKPNETNNNLQLEDSLHAQNTTLRSTACVASTTANARTPTKAMFPDRTCTPMSRTFSRTPSSLLENPTTGERLRQIKERIKTGYQVPLQPIRITGLTNSECDSSLNSSVSPGPNTPSKFLGADVSFKPAFDIRNAMASLDSPVNPNASLPLEDLYVLKVNRALRYEIETTGGIVPDRSMDDLQAEGAGNKVLDNVVVVVSKKLRHIQSELNKITEQLGGQYRWKYDKSCTHFVHQGKANENNRELRIAQDDGKIIVSPEWLYICKQKNTRVEERFYPYTYNRQLQLDVMMHKEPSPNSPRKDGSTVDSTSAVLRISSDPKSARRNCQNDSNKKIMETANKQMDEIFAATKIAKDKRKSKRNNDNSALSSPSDCREELELPKSRMNERTGSLVLDHWNTEHTDSVPISWDDPTSRIERAKLAAHLSKDSQSFSPVYNRADLQQLETRENITSPTSDMPEPVSSEMRFLVAGLSSSERKRVTQIVEELGGCNLDSSTFDPTSTHVIIGELINSEKCLSAIAAGKWVIHPSYIDECEKAGRFLKVDKFEWADHHGMPETKKKFAEAARTWRIRLNDMRANLHANKCARVGAFQDWTVILFMDKKREEKFKRLLEAGLAKVLNAVPPFSNVMGVTHAFIEFNKVQTLDEIDIRALVASGVHCVKMDYTSHFLVEGGSDANIKKYYVAEALAELENLPLNDKIDFQTELTFSVTEMLKTLQWGFFEVTAEKNNVTTITKRKSEEEVGLSKRTRQKNPAFVVCLGDIGSIAPRLEKSYDVKH